VRPLGRRPRSASSHRPARSTDDLRGKLRALRTAQGLTLEDLARSVGLSKSALIESGRIDPSLEKQRRLVQALKVTLATSSRPARPSTTGSCATISGRSSTSRGTSFATSS
jgi:transcriptional regulator with XRE-family HTH domain